MSSGASQARHIRFTRAGEVKVGIVFDNPVGNFIVKTPESPGAVDLDLGISNTIIHPTISIYYI